MILLVEDNPNGEALALRAFKEDNIVNKIVLALDGVEALDFLFGTGAHEGRDTRVMPEMIPIGFEASKIDGLEVLKRVRADLRTKQQPVVILTSSNEEQDLIKGYSLGTNSYIRKPVDSTQFAEVVRKLKLNWLVLNEQLSVNRGSR